MKRLIDINPFKKFNSSSDDPKLLGGKKLWFRLIENSFGSLGGWLAVIIGIIILWQLSVWAGFLPSATFPLVDKDKWQAVFLTNGQVYFGHLEEENRAYIILKDAYYLRVAQQLQPPEQGSPQINLVKLGDEIHGPEDVMHIPKSQISFWENLREDSQVVRIIKQLKGE